MKYIDAELLCKEIERMREINKKAFMAEHISADVLHGRTQAINHLFAFLDTIPEQEHPIYQLNQILLDWVREAKTDKEQEARFEAYKRFFELYDENMEQEPEQPASEGLEEEAEEWAENEAYGKSDAEFEMAYKGFIAGAEWMSIHGNDIKEL